MRPCSTRSSTIGHTRAGDQSHDRADPERRPLQRCVLPGDGWPDEAIGVVDAASNPEYNRLFRGVPRGFSATHYNVWEPRFGVVPAGREDDPSNRRRYFPQPRHVERQHTARRERPDSVQDRRAEWSRGCSHRDDAGRLPPLMTLQDPDSNIRQRTTGASASSANSRGASSRRSTTWAGAGSTYSASATSISCQSGTASRIRA